MHRTQIYLDESQHHRLTALAKVRGTTSSSIIREAIDAYLAASASPADRLRALRDLASRIDSRDDDFDSATDVENLRAADSGRLDSLA